MFKINEYYSFSTYGNPVISNSYSGLKLGSILNYQTAIKFANIDLIQKQLYPYLPPGTESNHSKYTYLLFENNGKMEVIAEEWIIPNSVSQSEGKTYTLTLNNMSSTKMAIVRDQLRLLGISFNIL